MNPTRMRCPHFLNVRLTLPSGESIVIPWHQDVLVPSQFVAEALRRGCLPVRPAAPSAPKVPERAGEPSGKYSTGASDATDHLVPQRAPAAQFGAVLGPESSAAAGRDYPAARAALNDPVVQKIAAFLQAVGPAGATRTQLRDHFHRNVPGSNIEAALQLLRANGLATHELLRTRGRPSVIWRSAIGDLAAALQPRAADDRNDESRSGWLMRADRALISWPRFDLAGSAGALRVALRNLIEKAPRCWSR